MPENTQLCTSLTLARDLFLTAKEAERCTARTVKTYRWTLDKFIAWLDTQGVSDAQGITAHRVRLFLAQLDKQGHRAGYIHTYARVVKTWLRFLHADGILPANVMAQVAMPRLDKQILPAYTPDEARALLDACEDALDPERDIALVLLLLDTGVRAAELCALTVGDVDAKTGAVTVTQGKGRKDRIAYIGAKARRAVLRYLLTRPTAGKADPLFPSHKTGDHLTPNGLILLCRRLGARAAVADCHPHKFRRTAAIWSLRAGMDLVRLAALLGHEDLKTLQKYLKLVEADLETAHREHGAVDHMLQGKKGG